MPPDEKTFRSPWEEPAWPTEFSSCQFRHLTQQTLHDRVWILLGPQEQEPGLAPLSPQGPQVKQGSARQEQQLQEHFSAATCEQVDLSSCPIQGLKTRGWPPQGTRSWLSLPYVLQPMTPGPVLNHAQALSSTSASESSWIKANRPHLLCCANGLKMCFAQKR